MPDIGDAFLTFAQTASLALPEPVGVLASAGFAVVQMFLGSGSDESQQIVEAITDVVNLAVSTLQLDTIQDYGTHIQDANNDLNTWTTTMKNFNDVGDDKAIHAALFGDAVKPGIIALLNDAIASQSRPLPDALNQLNKPDYLYNKDDDVAEATFNFLSSGVGVLLTYRRLAVQTTSMTWPDQDDVTTYSPRGKTAGEYIDTMQSWRDDSVAWNGTISGIVDTLKTNRLALVGPLEQGPGWIDGKPLFYFKDSGPGGKNSDQKEYDQAEQDRQQYLENLSGQLDSKYAKIILGVKTWTTNLDEWCKAFTPAKPIGAPVSSVISQPSGSEPQVVLFAVSYQNSIAEGAIGTWSSGGPSPDTPQVTLSRIPCDPTKTGTARNIYMQYRGSTFKVLTISDNSSTSVDIEPQSLIKQHYALSAPTSAPQPLILSGGPKHGIPVTFAVSFANDYGEGPIGPQSVPYWPSGVRPSTLTLLHVPVDPTGMATSRKIYQLDASQQKTLLFTMSDNVSTEFILHE